MHLANLAIAILFRHNLRLLTYAIVFEFQGREPYRTHCNESVARASQVGLSKDCVDYIWYNADGLIPTAVLDVPEEQLIDQHIGLPSIIFPSDHLPIYVEFQFKQL